MLATAANSELERVCETIGEPGGEALLRLLRAVYYGTTRVEGLADIGDDVEGAVQSARDLELLKPGEDLLLTRLGYLVGNVAKEYCNWVDNGREMPAPHPPVEFFRDKDVLDLGCSFGRWLWMFEPHARSVVGIELQPEYPVLGRVLARLENIESPVIHQGSVEDLDDFVEDESFDFVFSRLVFNHIYIRPTLERVRRVLRPGGILWMQVETFSDKLKMLFKLEKDRSLRGLAFRSFALANSACYQLTGRQMRVRVKGRMHSEHKPAYPSLGSWKRSLAAAGLGDFVSVTREAFHVTRQ